MKHYKHTWYLASACFKSIIFFDVLALSMTLLVHDVILLFSVKSEYSIMSSKKVIVCPNIGSDMTFPYRMAKLHHSWKGCNSTPTQQSIVKVDKRWECKLCRTRIKHQNNISRHKKVCNPNKTPKYHGCIHCRKVFQHLSKLNQHLKIHTDKGGIKVVLVILVARYISMKNT